MATKCNRCGVESSLDASFFKEPKSFSRAIRTYCPSCWVKRQHATLKWVFLSNIGVGALGLLLWLTRPQLGTGPVFVNLFLYQIFLTLTILPHELGHAGMARLLGMRVFKIYVGTGRTLFSLRLLGFEVEFRAVPMGGLALATHRTLDYLRPKQFAFILAGPTINLLLLAAVLPVLDLDQLWSFQPLEQGVQLGLMFFYANLTVLIENLWPHDITTLIGKVPSDGKQLFLTFFLSREQRVLHHASHFVMEASVCHQKGDNHEAREWLEKGLALYPDNEALLSWHGVIALELAEYEQARACFLELLNRESAQPLMRPVMLNNIAYADALIGGDELLKEADALSSEAMAAVSWMPAIKGTRGTVLAALGRYDEGIPLLQESMSQAESPNHKAQNACLIAEAECRRGKLDVARRYLEEARRLDPKCSLLSRAERALRSGPIANSGSTPSAGRST